MSGCVIDDNIKLTDSAVYRQNQHHSILYGNVQSILNKMLEIRAVVYDVKPSIIMLCETFTRDDISKAFLRIDGYELIVRKNGKDTVNGTARVGRVKFWVIFENLDF